MATPIKFVSAQRRLKAHRKSRAGCYRCKAKRVKCSESKPQCSNCIKHGMQCIYPDKEATTPPTQINLIQPSPFGYSLRDLRLFHDFMTTSYPHLPLESDTAWLNDIPMIAQQHEFLMHGILALGAAHLHSRTNLELKETVDRHRFMAMQGLNNRGLIEDDETARSNGDPGTRLTALLATSYLLAFTASYMGDSLSFHLVLVRACSSITSEIVTRGLESPLLPWNSRSATSEPHLEVMRRKLRDVNPLSVEDVNEGIASVQLVEQECSFAPFQWNLLQIMKGVLEHVQEPYEAYCYFIQIWNAFASMSPGDFAAFTNVTDTTSVALQAHFLALEAVLKPWLMTEVGKDNAQRHGLTALPASATLTGSGPSSQLVRWPLKVLSKQAKNTKEILGK